MEEIKEARAEVLDFYSNKYVLPVYDVLGILTTQAGLSYKKSILFGIEKSFCYTKTFFLVSLRKF